MKNVERDGASDRQINPFANHYYESVELRRFGFKHVGDNVRIASNSTIIGLENISLGNNIRIDGNVVISALEGSLKVGNHVHIGTACFVSCAGGVEISDFAGLSQGVRIYSSSDDYSGRWLTNPTVPSAYLNVRVAPVVIDKHVVIGSASVILPGVTIGEGSAVGAMSLVTTSLEAWGIYFGSPVTRISNRSRRILLLEAEFLSEPTYEVGQ